MIIPFAGCRVANTPSSGIHPVKYQGSYLLGGMLDGRVVNADEMAAKLTGKEIYRHVGDIAICGNWNPLPRPVTAITPDDADRKAVAAHLRAQGLRHPVVRITREYAADLDGDFIKERIICATTPTPNYLPGPLGMTSVKPDDYSTVIVVKRTAGISSTFALEGEYYPSVNSYTVAVKFEIGGIYDLDGDGIMEVIVESHSSEEVFAISTFKYYRNIVSPWSEAVIPFEG